MIQISKLESATENEALELTSLLRQLSLNPESQRSVSVERLREVISQPATSILVIRDDEKIVGMGTLTITDILTGHDGQIDDVVVNDTYRGQGLGRQLIERLLDLAREKKVATVYLTSRPARVAANKLYQSMGFKLVETNAYELDL
jgi:ribosomal protein S18 acetylase RimI-like enzyme